MPEPFKNLFNEKIITSMAHHLAKRWSEFDIVGFNEKALYNLDNLELKERSTQITNALATFLPPEYKQAADIMLTSLAPENDNDNDSDSVSDLGIKGWAVMPMADYVGIHGLEDFDLSMILFKEMTKRFSAEFGIRYFLTQEPDRTLEVLKSWLDDPNHHVRRLISEGTRPRLPWGMRLSGFVADPAPILPLLEALKDDDEEYVRRSVANNLNDIAKDHPDIVAKTAEKWMKGANKNRERLVRHGCRTLIKQGHKETLKALGYGTPHVSLEKMEITSPEVIFGDSLTFDIALTSTSDKVQNLIIDYAIHHRKANGTTSAKIFKWKVIMLKPSETLRAKRKHAIKKITTRVYYPGKHYLEIFVNGVSLGRKDFELIM